MSRLDARALAVLVVLIACSMGAPRERSTPEPAAPRADRVLLALAPTGDITTSAYAPSAPGWLWAPNLAGAGGTYLVTWIVLDGLQTNVMGARVTADGALLDPSGILISSAPGDQKGTAVAGGDAGWLVAWIDQRSGLFPTGTNATSGDIYAARVALDGTVLDPGGIPVATGTTPRTDPGVAFTGTGWLVTWKETPSSVSGALLSAAGDVGPAFPVATSTVVSSTATVGFTDLSCGGTTCLLAFTYLDFTVGARDVLAVRIDAALGAAIDPVPFAISAASGWQDAPKVSFDGRDFLVVFEDNRAEGSTGGAIDADSSVVHVTQSEFRNNTSAVAGGAIASSSSPDTSFARRPSRASRSTIA